MALVAARRVVDQTAGIQLAGGGQQRGDLHGDGIEQRLREDVAHPRACERDLLGLARRGGNHREIALQHGGSHGEARIAARVGPLDGGLFADEEEDLVLHDGTADGAAELVLLEAVAGKRGGGPAVEVVVADVFKDVAMEGVGAGTGGDGHRGRRVLAGLGTHGAGFHLEFLEGVREWQRLVEAVEWLVGGGTVEREGNLVGVGTSHRDGHRGVVLVRVEIGCVGPLVGGSADQQDQLGRFAGIQREVDNLLVVDHLAHAGTAGLHAQAFGLNGNCFAHGADFQCRVDGGVGIDFENDARLGEGTEAFLGYFQLVGADRKVRKDIGSVGGGDRRTAEAGFCLESLDGGTGDGPAAGVVDRTRNLGAAGTLGP